MPADFHPDVAAAFQDISDVGQDAAGVRIRGGGAGLEIDLAGRQDVPDLGLAFVGCGKPQHGVKFLLIRHPDIEPGAVSQLCRQQARHLGRCVLVPCVAGDADRRRRNDRHSVGQLRKCLERSEHPHRPIPGQTVVQPSPGGHRGRAEACLGKAFRSRAAEVIAQPSTHLDNALGRKCRHELRHFGCSVHRARQGRCQGEDLGQAVLQLAYDTVEQALICARCRDQCYIRIRKGDGTAPEFGHRRDAHFRRSRPVWAGNAQTDDTVGLGRNPGLSGGTQDAIAGLRSIGRAGIEARDSVLDQKSQGKGRYHRTRCRYLQRETHARRRGAAQFGFEAALGFWCVGDRGHADLPRPDRDLGAWQPAERVDRIIDGIAPTFRHWIIRAFQQVGNGTVCRQRGQRGQQCLAVGLRRHQPDQRNARVIAQYFDRKAWRGRVKGRGHVQLVDDPCCIDNRAGRRHCLETQRFGRGSTRQVDLQPVSLHLGPGHLGQV